MFLAAILLQPLVGIGVANVVLGRGLGTGVQPAFLAFGLAILLLLLPARSASGGAARPRSPFSTWTVALLLWAVASLAFSWRLESVGLAGEVAWLKSLKQIVLLAFFVAIALLPVALRGRGWELGRAWGRIETLWSLGLGFTVLLALLQGLHFQAPTPIAERVLDLFDTNPSIAAGSEELYLGHRFVGIARLRGPFPEPLHLGSYLLASLPVALAGAWGRRGFARGWRLAVAGIGGMCLLLTFSRGAYLGAGAMAVAVGVAVARGRLPRPSGRSWALGAGFTVGLALLAAWGAGLTPLALPGLLVDRLAQSLAGHDMSNLTRFYAWEAATRLFLAHPLGGVGWGGFGFHYYGVAAEGGSAAHFGWPMTNSLPLLVAAELGLVGLGLAGRVLWPALRGLRGPDPAGPSPRADVLRFALATASLGVLVHGLTFSQWNLPHLWVLIGLSAALHETEGEVV